MQVVLGIIAIILFGFFPLAVFAQSYTVAVPPTGTFRSPFLGFGAEWDPFFWNDNNQGRGVNQADWNLITSRMKELNVGIIRLMMQLTWVQPTAGIPLSYTSTQMQSVFKYLDYACANNIDVILTDWGWAVRADDHVYNSPTDVRYAQGVAEYLKEFIDRRGYSCIKYLVIGNEPDNEIQKDFGQSAYETMYRNINTALKANGMRTKIKLMGPDSGGNWDFMKTSISGIGDILDAYDFHRYASTAETGNFSLPGTWETLWSHLDMWRGEVDSRDGAGVNKPVLLTEMGNSGGSTNSHPDIDTFEYALHMADYGTTLLTTRTDAGIAWTMHDVYYFDGGQYMGWGMWKYKDASWAIRPWGQSYGLLIKHAPKGSIRMVINGTPPTTPGLTTKRFAALQRPDGGWNLFFVNRDTTSTTMTITLPSTPIHDFAVYQFDRGTHAQYSTAIALPAIGSSTIGKTASITVPGETFLVYSQNMSGTPTVSLSPTPVSGDLTGDGHVTSADLLVAINQFTSIFTYTSVVAHYGN